MSFEVRGRGRVPPVALAIAFLVAVAVTPQFAEAIISESRPLSNDLTDLSTCEEKMLQRSVSADRVWARRIQRFYSIGENWNVTYDIPFFVSCNGTAINELDRNCSIVSRMVYDAARSWLRYLEDVLPIRVLVSRGDRKLSWRRSRYGVDVDFVDSELAHTDSNEYTCPFGPYTLAHADHSILHVNMRKKFTLARGRRLYDRNTRESNMYNVILHEMGHVLGLSHVNETASVMFPVSRPYEPDRPIPRDYKALEIVYREARDERLRRSSEESRRRAIVGSSGVVGSRDSSDKINATVAEPIVPSTDNSNDTMASISTRLYSFLLKNITDSVLGRIKVALERLNF